MLLYWCTMCLLFVNFVILCWTTNRTLQKCPRLSSHQRFSGCCRSSRQLLFQQPSGQNQNPSIFTTKLIIYISSI
ncbi:hypothetical protein VIGAN_02073200, partial [Vigna angularis var. angularis]